MKNTAPQSELQKNSNERVIETVRKRKAGFSSRTFEITKNAIRRVRKDGFAATLNHAGKRLGELTFDWRYNVRTSGIFHLPEPYAKNSDIHHYSPTTCAGFQAAMNHISIRAGHDVFVDFGSGMGRIVMLAAFYQFKKVIGVELNSDFHSIAESNIANVQHLLACRDISLVHTDASSYNLPEDATVLYFANPFKGKILEAVINNINQSLIRKPREITILYWAADAFERLTKRLNWITKVEEFRAVHHFSIFKASVPL